MASSTLRTPDFQWEQVLPFLSKEDQERIRSSEVSSPEEHREMLSSVRVRYPTRSEANPFRWSLMATGGLQKVSVSAHGDYPAFPVTVTSVQITFEGKPVEKFHDLKMSEVRWCYWRQRLEELDLEELILVFPKIPHQPYLEITSPTLQRLSIVVPKVVYEESECHYLKLSLETLELRELKSDLSLLFCQEHEMMTVTPQLPKLEVLKRKMWHYPHDPPQRWGFTHLRDLDLECINRYAPRRARFTGKTPDECREALSDWWAWVTEQGREEEERERMQERRYQVYELVDSLC